MVFIRDCGLNIPFILIYNPGWVPFIPDCDVVRCCLFLIVIWTSLVIFFYNPSWVLFSPNCDVAITVHFFYNSAWVLFIPNCDLDIPVYFFLQRWMGAIYS